VRVLLATSGGGGRTTLSVMRSLARAGVRLTLGSDRFRGEAFRSRHAHARISYPNPAVDVGGFRASLLAHLRSGDFDVLLPLSDYTNLAIGAIRSEVESLVKVPMSSDAAIRGAQDKLATLNFAQALGIAIPETHAPENLRELEEVATKIEYPCILKPRSGAGARHTYVVESAAELVRRYEKRPRQNDLLYDYRPLVQEYIPGQVHEVCALFCRGEPRALLTQARLRMRPATGGAGVDNVTTREDDLQEQAVELLRALHWHGPAQVEFKRDARDGTPTLLEVNPRFWGTLDLSVRAGIDFPNLSLRLAVDGDVEPCWDYRVGLRYRWLDVSRGRSFWNVLRPSKAEMTDFLWSDPLPQLYLLSTWFTRRMKRRRSRRR
jgi:predicted ATP-grasp superfamily ATP-dependent carboligase